MKKRFIAGLLLLSLLFSGLNLTVYAKTKNSAKKNDSNKNEVKSDKNRRPGSAKKNKRKPSGKSYLEDKPVMVKIPEMEFEEEEREDPDLPSFMQGVISKAEYLKGRSEEIAKLRGIEEGKPYDVNNRTRAIAKMEKQEQERLTSNEYNPNLRNALMAAWNSNGPAPIPNGQTSNGSAVSGRVTAIAVHPTNANIAYVGTAQGGLYRTLDGGTNWTPLMDTASSLAIGAVTINPVTTTQVFVGTGEGNNSLDSYAGVGLYRIDNAESGTPTVNGPFSTRVAGTGTAVSNGIAFNNTSITKILVDPINQNRIFVGNSTGVYGLSGTGFPLGGSNGFIGLWFSENAQAGTITFSRVSGFPGAGVCAVTDMVFEPGSSDNLLVAAQDFGAAPDDSGVYRSTNASTASVAGNISPTFTRTLTNTANGAYGTVLAINKVGATVSVYAAYNGTTSGSVVKSIDGGASWGSALTAANGFCGGQCFYDTAIAVDPNDANFVYLAGSATGASTRIFARSTDGGATFSANEAGLHADSHAIGIAPSNTSVVYTGNDGGIYKTINVKAAGAITWSSLNNTQFLATQFMSIDTHPSNINYTIGGTQDNGTNFLQSNGTWFRTDSGDGGYAVIDQNATNTTNVTMYHTYFNQTNAMGYGRVTTTADALIQNWSFFGCGFIPTPNNGMTCAATAIRFYAPMERGPGNPNTLYFGSDVLYRSSDSGANMTKVSQEPITSGVAISSIGIAPTNDNVRLIGLANGGLFGTTTGSTTLTDFDPSNTVPNNFVTRTVIDPTNSNTAYVALSNNASGAQNVWKTTTLNSFAETGLVPTWSASSTGLPPVPVNALIVDPLQSNTLYAGTDIGVYASTDGGANWTVFGTGLPRVAVFDIAIAGTNPNRKLRIATHGKGMWDIDILGPTAAGVSISGRVLNSRGRGIGNAMVNINTSFGDNRTVYTNPLGYYRINNVEVGQSCVITVSSRNYEFTPQAFFLNEALENLDFRANLQTKR